MRPGGNLEARCERIFEADPHSKLFWELGESCQLVRMVWLGMAGMLGVNERV
jgi:hypothetical protein